MKTSGYELPQLLPPFSSTLTHASSHIHLLPQDLEKEAFSSVPHNQLSCACCQCLSVPTPSPKALLHCSSFSLLQRQPPPLLALFPHHSSHAGALLTGSLQQFLYPCRLLTQTFLKIHLHLQLSLSHSSIPCSICPYSNVTFAGYNLVKDADPGLKQNCLWLLPLHWQGARSQTCCLMSSFLMWG